MSWKTLAVLLVLAAGLGGFLIVDSQWIAPKREKAESAKGRLWTVEPKDVDALTITRKDETIKLKRAGDGWEMVEPVKTRADGRPGRARSQGTGGSSDPGRGRQEPDGRLGVRAGGEQARRVRDRRVRGPRYRSAPRRFQGQDAARFRSQERDGRGPRPRGGLAHDLRARGGRQVEDCPTRPLSRRRRSGGRHARQAR